MLTTKRILISTNFLVRLGVHPQYSIAMQNMIRFLSVLAFIQLLAWSLPSWPISQAFPNYIIWHDILEAISIIISTMIFAIGWNYRDKNIPGNIIILASVFFSVGLLDFFHTVSHVGMPDFFSPNDAQKHLHYWLAARFLAAAVLLLVAIRDWKPLIHRRTPHFIFGALVILAFLLNWTVINHQSWFPDLFIPGKRLTQLKKNLEYLIIAMNLATAAILLAKMRKPQPYTIMMLFGAVLVMGMSEFYFTLYTTTQDSYNVLGHIYKVIAYVFIYRAIVVAVIDEPYRLLKISNNDLSAKKQELVDAQSLAKIGNWHVNFSENISNDRWKFSNESRKIWGLPEDTEVTTQTVFALIHLADRIVMQQVWNEAKRGQGPMKWEHRIVVDGSIRWVQVIAKFVFDAHGYAIEASGTTQDITENKERDWQLALMNLALNRANEAVYLMNNEGDFLYVNDSACKVLGYTRDELNSGMGVTDIHPGMTREKMREYWEYIKNNDPLTLEAVHQTKSGDTFPVEVSANYFEFEGQGYNMALVRDISDRKILEESKSQALNLISKISNRVPGVVYQYLLRPDGSSCFPYASSAISDIYRVTPEEIKEDASKVFIHLHPEDLDGVVASIQKSAADLTPWIHEYRVKFNDGTINWLLGNAMPEKQDDGSILWYGFITNINDRKHDELKLRIAATAFESQEGIGITDADRNFLSVNRAFTEITGYSAEEVIGKNPRLLQSGQHNADFYAAMWDSINTTGKWEGEIWNRRKNGEIYPEKMSISSVKNNLGSVTNYVTTLSDITRAKVAEDEIKFLAFYDPLTHLPNRRLLLDRLNQSMSFVARTNRTGALLFIDLDNFKTLNDTLGHNFGDLLLQQVAKRLKSCVRDIDTIARLGGDEFVVMLEDLNNAPLEAAEQAKIVATKIIYVLNQDYQLGSHLYHNTPSIGITLFNDKAQSIDELLKQADIAMYQSKKAGRNTLHFFDPKMQEAINLRASLEAELRIAVEHNQFQLFYQIQVGDLNSDGTHIPLGAEALIRWIHPKRGVISPGEFIALAEDTELILPIGQWVLETACRQITIWQQELITKNLVLSINVSAKQFRQPDFVSQVKSAIQRHAIKPRLLKLELTESLLLHNINDTITKMNAIKNLGVQFSLDDFGTGYSSLQYLKKLPFNELKIDQSFVRDLAIDSNDKAIVITIITMAKSLNMNVIAEGVEAANQLQFLLNEGCMHYQGYLFGRPLPIDEFEQLLRTKPTRNIA